jgi:AmiR/NasT family two-component response regulator
VTAELVVASPVADTVEELRAELAAQVEKNANLEVALLTSRRIGAAIGVIVAGQKVTYEQAFDLLRQVSQHSHRKLRDVAEDVLLTGVLPQRPRRDPATPDARPTPAATSG